VSNGATPAAAGLAEAAAPYGKTADVAAAELHAGTCCAWDAAGQVRAAYPFSAVPTPHLVQISGGPRVHAMRAIEALGIPAMLGTGVTITSAGPRTGEPVTVTVAAGGLEAAWERPPQWCSQASMPRARQVPARAPGRP
jgi:Alkylmercury lyase